MPFNQPPQLEFAFDDHGRQKFSRWRRVYRLTHKIAFDHPGIQQIEIPVGFESDLATIPTFPIAVGGLVLSALSGCCVTWWLGVEAGRLAVFATGFLASLLIGYLRPDGPWALAAFVHDALYKTKIVSRRIADAIFLEAMLETHVNLAAAMLLYLCVRCFGWTCYGRELA